MHSAVVDQEADAGLHLVGDEGEVVVRTVEQNLHRVLEYAIPRKSGKYLLLNKQQEKCLDKCYKMNLTFDTSEIESRPKVD